MSTAEILKAQVEDALAGVHAKEIETDAELEALWTKLWLAAGDSPTREEVFARFMREIRNLRSDRDYYCKQRNGLEVHNEKLRERESELRDERNLWDRRARDAELQLANLKRAIQVLGDFFKGALKE